MEATTPGIVAAGDSPWPARWMVLTSAGLFLAWLIVWMSYPPNGEGVLKNIGMACMVFCWPVVLPMAIATPAPQWLIYSAAGIMLPGLGTLGVRAWISGGRRPAVLLLVYSAISSLGLFWLASLGHFCC